MIRGSSKLTWPYNLETQAPHPLNFLIGKVIFWSPAAIQAAFGCGLEPPGPPALSFS